MCVRVCVCCRACAICAHAARPGRDARAKTTTHWCVRTPLCSESLRSGRPPPVQPVLLSAGTSGTPGRPAMASRRMGCLSNRRRPPHPSYVAEHTRSKGGKQKGSSPTSNFWKQMPDCPSVTSHATSSAASPPVSVLRMDPGSGRVLNVELTCQTCRRPS